MTRLTFIAILVLAALAVGGANPAHRAQTVDGITFASAPSVLFLPLREEANELGMKIGWDVGRHEYTLNNKPLPGNRLRTLPDKTHLIAVQDLAWYGAATRWDPRSHAADIHTPGHDLTVRRAAKRVDVDRKKLVLRAWQGARIVAQFPITVGVEGHDTPLGTFRAGPLKKPMHHSRKYHNVPMPWAVQVEGNIFVHGFKSVPRHPASHGCIRLPLDHGNPARWFYNWVEIGTPITIVS